MEKSENGHPSRCVVPSSAVQVGGGVARVGVPRAGATENIRVELIREGDTVKAIDVTCSCGQTIRLYCTYE